MLSLDLKDPAQHDLAWQHIAASDVLVEGYRPGVMDRLGLSADAVATRCPQVIYLSLSGYGQTGPDAQVPGHDVNYLASAGVLALSGRTPSGPPEHSTGLPIADLMASVYGLASVLAARFSRQIDGRAARLDVAMSDCLVHMMNVRRAAFEYKGVTSIEAQRRAVLCKPAYGVFETRDGRHISVAALEDQFWKRLASALSLGDIPDAWSRHEGRARDSDAVNAKVAAVTRQHDLESICSLLRAADVPAAPVLRPDELDAHPHHQARGLYGSVADRTDAADMARFPVRFS